MFPLQWSASFTLPPNAPISWFFLSPSEDDDVFVEDLDFLFNTGTLQLSRYLKHKHITGSSSHLKKQVTLSTEVEAFQGITAIDSFTQEQNYSLAVAPSYKSKAQN